jgi:hypothetical protein
MLNQGKRKAGKNALGIDWKLEISGQTYDL